MHLCFKLAYRITSHMHTFLVAKLLYKYKYPSIFPYIRQPRLEGNVIFSPPNWDIASIFVQIPLINEHLFYHQYFVRLFVGNATKGFATYGCCHPFLIVFHIFFGLNSKTPALMLNRVEL